MPVNEQAWPQGTPAWVDMMAKDFEATKQFYASLFGWEYEQGGEEFGYYATATLNGQAVAGLSPTPPGMEEMPSNWTTYLAVDDLEPVLERSTSAGGRVVMPAMTIESFGAMAMVTDPTGAVFGLWQSGQHTGVNRYNEHGCLVWNEVLVSDPEAAQEFYSAVFGCSFAPVEEGMPYWTIQVDGRDVGGLGSAEAFGGAPSHWGTYFAVDDVDAATAKVAELGGTVVSEPEDTDFGRMATVTGLSGERFQLMQPPAEAAPS